MFKMIMVLLISFTFVINTHADTHDTDNDLVPNSVDKCPNTPEGVFVTRDGCTQEITKVIYFEHASSHINYEDVQEIEQTAELINETPGYNIVISGHTDSIADANINMKLSEKRAIAVKNILLKNKVDNSKIETLWYGETRPVASNITVEGRRDNRRVTIVLK